MMFKCQECGFAFDANNTSCPQCGCPIESAESTTTFKCSECNSIVEQGAKNCSNCGFPCTPNVNTPPTPVLTPTPAPQVPQPIITEQELNDVPFLKKGNNLIFLCLGVLAIIAIAFAIYFGISNKPTKPTQPVAVESIDDTEKETDSKPEARVESSLKYVLAEKMWFRRTPQITNSNQIELLQFGAPFNIVSFEGNWAYIESYGRYGYVNNDFIVGEDDFIRFNSLISQSSRGNLMAAGRHALISYSKKEGRIGGYDPRADDLFPNEKKELQCTGYKETKFNSGETIIILKMYRSDNSSRWLTIYKVSPSGSFEFIADYEWINNPTVTKSGANYYIQ